VGTTFVGGIGKDVFGTDVKRFYEEEGIRYEMIEYEDIPTGNAGIFVSADGENEIIVALGANLAFSPTDIREGTLAGAQIVVCQNEIDLKTTLDTLRRSRRAGVTTVLNPAPMIPDFRVEYLADVDVLVPNESEFSALLQSLSRPDRGANSVESIHGLSDGEMHEVCRTLGVPTVIVTLGSAGCFVSQADTFGAIPACSGIEVLDTTGAGDAFVGGFASGMVQFGKDVLQAARYANVVAALSVTRPGTAPSMPHKAEIERFIRETGK
jgi:ribokinase